MTRFERQPTQQEETNRYSGGYENSMFEGNLKTDVRFWHGDLEYYRNGEPGYEGAIDGWGGYEVGKSVEDILEMVSGLHKSGEEKSLLIKSSKRFWKEGKQGERILRIIPPIQNSKGFNPEVVLELAERIGTLDRKSPDTYIFHSEEIHNDGSNEMDAIYNIFPIKSALLPPNTFWHELMRGNLFGWGGGVIVTVNKRYIPTTSNISIVNRTILRLQGV